MMTSPKLGCADLVEGEAVALVWHWLHPVVLPSVLRRAVQMPGFPDIEVISTEILH